MPRGFRVQLLPQAKLDLQALNDDKRREAYRGLERLTDRDIPGFEELPAPRGPHGAWVLVSHRRWRYVCEWDAGNPWLWAMGVELGMLTVARITDETNLQQRLQDLP